MKWLLDLIWPKSPKTMAEVESSYGNSPYENLRPPAWKDELATVSNGPTVPDVDSLSRQVVALREEVARVKVEAMQAILEARHEAARDAADWRGEWDKLWLRVSDVEGTERDVVSALHELDRRLQRVESFFPVGWVPGTTYNRYHGDMFICVYPSVLLGKNDYSVSVSCVNNAGVGVTEERRFATLSEAMARGEQLAEELRVAMLERTVIGGTVVTPNCSEVVRG